MGQTMDPWGPIPAYPTKRKPFLIWDGQMVIRTAAGLSCYGETANTSKPGKDLARAAIGQPNLHVLEYTCGRVSSFQSLPHRVVPISNATVAVSPGGFGLSLRNDNEVVHTRVYFSDNRPGVPLTPEFKRGIQKWVRNLRGHAENCHVWIGRQQPSPGDRGDERLPMSLANLIVGHIRITFPQRNQFPPKHRYKRSQEQYKEHYCDQYRRAIRLALKLAQPRSSKHCRGQ